LLLVGLMLGYLVGPPIVNAQLGALSAPQGRSGLDTQAGGRLWFRRHRARPGLRVRESGV